MQAGKVLPDELEHQELVEISVEQRSRDRIEPPVVVVRSPGKIDNHDAFTLLDHAAAPEARIPALQYRRRSKLRLPASREAD